jgi:hypothetical protein
MPSTERYDYEAIDWMPDPVKKLIVPADQTIMPDRVVQRHTQTDMHKSQLVYELIE